VAGNAISGTFLLKAVSDGDQGVLTVASFLHGIPAPGALALLGLAGLLGHCRRR